MYVEGMPRRYTVRRGDHVEPSFYWDCRACANGGFEVTYPFTIRAFKEWCIIGGKIYSQMIAADDEICVNCGSAINESNPGQNNIEDNAASDTE